MTQFLLEFSKPDTTNLVGKNLLIKTDLTLGIGEIVSLDSNKLRVYFQKGNLIKSIDKDSDRILFLPDKKALKNQELLPGELNLSLNSLELKYAHIYDKLSSLSNSRTRLLPHQIESTYLVVNSLKPRFILADEVGLGKTIEAGLIMK